MKKVLVITYHYPPINNGATPRLSQFVKYLPQYGYIPTVLTTNKFGMTDDDKNILRVREYGVIEKSRILLITYKIIRKILYRTGLVVDPLIIWRLQCIRFIDKLLLHEKFDLVFASFPPSVNIELAIYLKKKYNLPLVSDFRDGLVFEPLRKENVFRRLSDKYFEKKVVKNSDYIITVTPPITKYFHLKYENCKVDTITNGFQEYDYQENILLNTDNVNILYSGRISLSSASQTINLFIDVLSGLISTNVFAKKIKFIVIGDLTKQEIDYLNKKLNSNFEYRGLVEHHQSILFQKQANYLLFVASESRSSLATTKIYEYRGLAFQSPNVQH